MLIDFFEDKKNNIYIWDALDIWFGLWQDSKYLAEKWYIVDAIDKDPIAMMKAKELNNHDKINFIQKDISVFVFSKKYDLIIAFLSLFNLSKSSAHKLFIDSVNHLNYNGYIIIRLLWLQDERKDEITTWDRKELEKEFLKNDGMKIVYLNESFESKKTALWKTKNRHFVDIIIKKDV